MQIVDLSANYKKSILENNSLPEYETAFPELFDHYFKYWARREHFVKTLNEKEVEERKSLVVNKLKYIEEKINNFGLSTEKIKIILFVGQNTANGHAFRHNDEFVVFIPIEAYKTALQADIFITHEIIHALHYTDVPEFYFRGKGDKNSVSRQLITEGLATYLSAGIMGVDSITALWADYIPTNKRDQWWKKCMDANEKLFKLCADGFYSTNQALFESANPKDIYSYRSGYYVGYKVIEEIINTCGIKSVDLLKYPKDKIYRLAFSILIAV